MKYTPITFESMLLSNVAVIKFLPLTFVAESKKNNCIIDVSLDDISYIKYKDDKTIIYLKSRNTSFEVEETREDILALVEELKN